MQKLNKLGAIALDQLTGIIILILIAGIMLTVGLRVDDEMQTGIDTTTSTITLSNETSVTVVNTTGTTVGEFTTAHNRNCVLTVIELTNTTGTPAIVIPSANYTVTACTISINQDDAYNTHSLLNISGSVSYSKDTVEYNATGDVKEGKTNISTNLGLLGTVIIFGVIISLVVVAFAISGT